MKDAMALVNELVNESRSAFDDKLLTAFVSLVNDVRWMDSRLQFLEDRADDLAKRVKEIEGSQHKGPDTED